MGRSLSAGEQLRRDLDAALPAGAEWDERETAVIALAQAQADDLARLEALLIEQGSTVLGAAGQERLHPAYGELRLGRLALGRLLASIRLPDEGMGSSQYTQQQRAAKARWDRQRQKREGG